MQGKKGCKLLVLSDESWKINRCAKRPKHQPRTYMTQISPFTMKHFPLTILSKFSLVLAFFLLMMLKFQHEDTADCFLVAVYSDGCHGVWGNKDRDALGEWNDGTHESSEWPVVQHQPDLNITFYESFNIADQTFLSNSNTTTIQQLQYIYNVLASSR